MGYIGKMNHLAGRSSEWQGNQVVRSQCIRGIQSKRIRTVVVNGKTQFLLTGHPVDGLSQVLVREGIGTQKLRTRDKHPLPGIAAGQVDALQFRCQCQLGQDLIPGIGV